ncbi:hypothetical protein JAAARDRAFT_56778 [Jaapia argillacea MUCL 33604]|uniref:Uncharacterized protein n=1 Tax=Jaapia argillacea MUCL 33604 TaxID=933084 RepID=A0A067PYB8_9AGAM|nr:hypothetical protein JAAARDRAFT_56778 [Jaapia argillacea MUCL 33604]
MSTAPGPRKAKKSTANGRKKRQAVASSSAVPAPPEAKNEGENPHWAFQPPDGSTLLDHDVDFGEFDWDEINKDEDLEIWLFRVPEGLKAKYLDSAKLDTLPSTSRNARMGSVSRKQTQYDIWSLGNDPDHGGEDIGGEEVRGLSCLLPRGKKGGKLYLAPKPIARHVVIAAKPALPTPEPSSDNDSNPTGQPKKSQRYSYPAELLTHRFMPYGSIAEVGSTAMDVDTVESLPPQPSPSGKPKKTKKESPEKGQKRKVEVDTPKKSKKAKVVS